MENSARPETWARDTGAGSRYAAAGINIINIRQLSHCNDFIAVQCNYKTIYDVITKKNFDMKFNLRFVSQRTWPANLKLKFIHLYTQLTKLQLHASLLYIAAIETTTDLPCTVATSNICRNWSVPRLRKWPQFRSTRHLACDSDAETWWCRPITQSNHSQFTSSNESWS